MSQNDDVKLDALLADLREPLPQGAAERVWQKIDTRLQGRPTMHTPSYLQRSGLVRLGPALAAACVLLMAYVVGMRGDMVRELFYTSARELAGPDDAFFVDPLRPDRPVTVTTDFEIADHCETDDAPGEDVAPDSMSTFSKRNGRPDLNNVSKLTGRGAIKIGGSTDVPVDIEGREADERSQDVYEQAAARLARTPKGPATEPATEKAEPAAETGTRPDTGGQADERAPFTEPAKTPDKEPAAAHSLRKVIKTAELALEADAYAPASRRVDELVTRYQGFYADSRVTQHDDGTTSARIVIRVPQQNFEALYAALKEIGRVKAENARGEDVTAQYADLEARIRNAQHLERRLLALLEEKRRKDKMSEILEVEREIGRVRETIERYQGRMRVMADKIRLGTIRLTLAEPRRSVPEGDLSIEVEDAQAAEQALDQLAASLGGTIDDRRTSKRADGTIELKATVRVPLAAFGRLVQGLRNLGRVRAENVQGYDVAGAKQPKDAEATMARLRVSLAEAVSQTPAGTARIEVRTLDRAAQAIAGLLKQFGGRIQRRQEQRSGGQANATYVVRFPRKHYAGAATALSTVGRVADRQFRGVDVVPPSGGAGEVLCEMTLVLFERARQQPSASATVTTPSLADVPAKLQRLLEQVDGAVQSHVEQRSSGSPTTAKYVLRCRRSRFRELADGIDRLGRVEHKHVQGLTLETVEGAAADALCTFNLSVHERRVPVPAAEIGLKVTDARAARQGLERLRDSHKALTEGVRTDQQPDGALTQDWRFRVPVGAFDAFVAGIADLGRVRTKQVRGVGAGAEEQPDPEALADVRVTVTQPSPYAPPEEETSGSIRLAIRSGWKHFYTSIGVIIRGLLILAPWFLVILSVHYGIKRIRRRQTPDGSALPESGNEDEEDERTSEASGS